MAKKKHIPATVADLKPCPWNPRAIDGEAMQGLQASVKAFGDISGIVFNTRTGHLVAGHQRLTILKQTHKLTLEGDNGTLAVVTDAGTRFPVRLVDWDDATEKAANVAANSPHIAGRFTEGLAPILVELETDLPELTASLRLGELRADLPPVEPQDGQCDPDAIPDPLPDAITQPSDLWIMGEHRLLCGDSTKAEDVDAVAVGRCDVCLTDPPYGCGEDYASHDDTQNNLAELAVGFFEQATRVCDVVGFTPGIPNIRHYPPPKWILCWYYGAGTGRNPWGFTCWQPMLVYGKDPYLARGKGCHPDGVHKLMTRDDANQNRAANHPCPKPMSVWAWFLERLSPEQGEVIYDPFSGSGTTIIACERLSRKARAIEIEPRYCDVAVRRWQTFTGKVAVLEATGEPFPEVADVPRETAETT